MSDSDPVESFLIGLQSAGDWPALCRYIWPLDGGISKISGVSSPLFKAAEIVISLADSKAHLKPVGAWLKAASFRLSALLNPPPLDQSQFNEVEFFSLQLLAEAETFMMLHDARSLSADARSKWLLRAENLADASQHIDTTCTASIYFSIGTFHTSLGSFPSALESYIKARNAFASSHLTENLIFNDFRLKILFNIYVTKKQCGHNDTSDYLDLLLSDLVAHTPESPFILNCILSISCDKITRDKAIGSLRSRWCAPDPSPVSLNYALKSSANLRRLGDLCVAADDFSGVEFYLKAINVLSNYRSTHPHIVIPILGDLKALVGGAYVGAGDATQSLIFSALAQRDFKICFRRNIFIDLRSCLSAGFHYWIAVISLKPDHAQRHPIRCLNALFSGLSIFEKRRLFTDNPEDNSSIHSGARMMYNLYLAGCLLLHEYSARKETLDEISVRTLVGVENSRSRCLFDLCFGNEDFPPGIDSGIKARYLRILSKMKAGRSRLSNQVSQTVETIVPTTHPVSLNTLIGKLGHPGSNQSRPFEESSDPSENSDQLQSDWHSIVNEIRIQFPDFCPDHPFHNFDETSLRKLPDDLIVIHVCEMQGYSNSPFILISTSKGTVLERVARTSFRSEISSWLNDYDNLKNHLSWRDDESIHNITALHEFGDQSLSKLSVLLGGILESVLMHTNSSIRRLVLCPDPLFAGLPIHAIPISGGESLFERFEVSYSPSLSLHLTCSERPVRRVGKVVVACPPDPALHFTKAECLRSWLDESPQLLSSDALDRKSILSAVAECEIFHFSGHAHFDGKDPLDSKLHSFGADPLLLRDCFGSLSLAGCSLVILNGCETGMSLSGRLEAGSENLDKGLDGILDENLSFSTGFLAAGARCILSTLWSVWDISSALVIWKFSQFYRSEEYAGQACLSLRAAIKWLTTEIKDGPFLRDHILPDFLGNLDLLGEEDRRTAAYCEEIVGKIALKHPDTPPFASPTFWAQYIVSGCGWGH